MIPTLLRRYCQTNIIIINITAVAKIKGANGGGSKQKHKVSGKNTNAILK